MSDDEEWKSSFVQGDDAALTAAIKAREAAAKDDGDGATGDIALHLPPAAT